jgi:leucyl aminopeptidase
LDIVLERRKPEAWDATFVALAVTQVEAAAGLCQRLAGLEPRALQRLARAEDFSAQRGQALSLTGAWRGGLRRLVLVGARDEHAPAEVALAEACAQAARLARTHRASRWALVVPALDALEPAACVRRAALGALAGAYHWSGVRAAKRSRPAGARVCRLAWTGREARGLGQALRWARVAGQALHLARDLVNSPPNLMTPRLFASRAATLAGEHGLRVRLWERRRLVKERCGLLLAVARGSAEPPCLVRLEHRPRRVRSRGRLVLVGKGITFDAGGLALKPQASQLEMKADMAGAAVVLAALAAAAELDLPWELHGLIPLAENMPDGRAVRTGDVLVSRDGRTVEVNHPDAEGRLVLADALCLARELEPDLILDLATLTGACKAALGPTTAGLFSNHDGWSAHVQALAARGGEDLWRLPLGAGLRSALESDSADLRNTGARFGGAIGAALFLQEFVAEVPWIHIDLAGPAFLEREHGLHPRGGSGFGLLTLLELLGSGLPARPSG